MKQQKKLEDLFPKGKVPDVDEFNRELDAMSEEGRIRFRKKIYQLAFIVWHALPQKYKEFIVGVIVHDRQAYARFCNRRNSDRGDALSAPLSCPLYPYASSDGSCGLFGGCFVERPGHVGGNFFSYTLADQYDGRQDQPGGKHQ